MSLLNIYYFTIWGFFWTCKFKVFFNWWIWCWPSFVILTFHELWTLPQPTFAIYFQNCSFPKHTNPHFSLISMWPWSSFVIDSTLTYFPNVLPSWSSSLKIASLQKVHSSTHPFLDDSDLVLWPTFSQNLALLTQQLLILMTNFTFLWSQL